MQWDAGPPRDGVADEPSEALRSHQRGLEHGDEVVQQLAVAKYALSVGDQPRAIDAIDAALGLARHSLSKLLDLVCPPETVTRPGALMRHTAAGAAEPPQTQAPAQTQRPAPAPRHPAD